MLQIIGVGNQLFELEEKETQVFNRRHAIGQIADQKKKFAKEMTYHIDAPKEPISAGDLIKQQQEILARNGANQSKRQRLREITTTVNNLSNQIAELQRRLDAALEDMEIANKSALDLLDESTEELENNINNIETINIKVRANLDKDKAEQDALEHSNQYAVLTTEIEAVRKEKFDLLTNADLPLPGLSVVDGELTYNGRKWDGMSGSEQLRVSVAIVRKLNPNCGFVLMDKLEQMDMDTMDEFGKWLEAEGLQVIATRVSTGEECSIIIEDGYVKDAEKDYSKVSHEPLAEPVQEAPKWKMGEF
jgi:polyhydroxyalkanoate synthesis regulator phasin